MLRSVSRVAGGVLGHFLALAVFLGAITPAERGAAQNPATAGDSRAVSSMVRIEGGTLRPLVKTLPRDVPIAPFSMDVFPVTRASFSEFLVKNPEWWREQNRKLFWDEKYLEDWSSPTNFPPPGDAPVTRVSWYAARAYCKWRGKRLATAAEWEYVAQASESKMNGTGDPEFGARILGWYTRRTEPNVAVGRWKNRWGLFDIHGLIWEWVEDFNGEFTSGDSRGDSSPDPNAFCGAAALNVSDSAKVEYAAFMRYALRGSLQGRYSLRDLGFRCVREDKES